MNVNKYILQLSMLTCFLLSPMNPMLAYQLDDEVGQAFNITFKGHNNIQYQILYEYIAQKMSTFGKRQAAAITEFDVKLLHAAFLHIWQKDTPELSKKRYTALINSLKKKEHKFVNGFQQANENTKSELKNIYRFLRWSIAFISGKKELIDQAQIEINVAKPEVRGFFAYIFTQSLLNVVYVIDNGKFSLHHEILNSRNQKNALINVIYTLYPEYIDTRALQGLKEDRNIKLALPFNAHNSRYKFYCWRSSGCYFYLLQKQKSTRA